MQTPTKQAATTTQEPPPAPKKTTVSKAWADYVDSQDTMDVDEARKLKAKDIGVQFGPVMDEAQFAEYRKSRNVKVIR